MLTFTLFIFIHILCDDGSGYKMSWYYLWNGDKLLGTNAVSIMVWQIKADRK